MLKRLMLFLAIFVTCPVVAEVLSDTNGNYGYIPENITSADCDDDPLTYHDNTGSGTYYLEAQWNAEIYNVIYNPGDCGVKTSRDLAQFGENYTVKGFKEATGLEPQKGYVFDGWSGDWNNGNPVFDESTGLPASGYAAGSQGTTSYSAGEVLTPYNIPNDLTLTAQCSAKKYNVIYKVGNCGGSEDVRLNALETGIAYTVLDPTAVSGAADYTTVNVPDDKNFKYWMVIYPNGVTPPAGYPVNNASVNAGYTFPAWAVDMADGEYLVFSAVCEINFKCPDEYPLHDVDVPTSNNQCYRLVNPDCNKVQDAAPDCITGPVYGDCSCVFTDSEKTKEYADGTTIPGVSKTCQIPVTGYTTVVAGYTFVDGECEEKAYNIYYHAVDGSTVIPDFDPNNYVSGSGNLTSYTQNTPETLLKLPTQSYNGGTWGDHWYLCDVHGHPVAGPQYSTETNESHLVQIETPVTKIMAALWKPYDIHLCVHWEDTSNRCTITYYGYTGSSTSNIGTVVPLNDLVTPGWVWEDGQLVYKDYKSYTFNPPDHVVFPTSVCGSECLPGQLNLPGSSWPVERPYYRSWAYRSGSFIPLSSTSGLPAGRCNISVYTHIGTTYTVDYDCTDGAEANGGPTTQSVSPNSGTSVSVSTHQSDKCVRPGWTFKWNCTETNGLAHNNVNPGGSFSISSNTNCVADWTQQKYPLKYNCMNASQRNVSGGEYAQDASVNISYNCTPDAGKEFNGWDCYYNNTNPNPTNPSLSGNPDAQFPGNGGAITMPAEPVTCYAQWTDKLYDVEYSCSGGSGTPPAKDEDHMVNTSVNLAENTCDASGNNEFKEWACKRKDNNQSVNTSVNNNMQTITSMPASDVLCEPVWNQQLTITYNCGTCAGFDGTCPTQQTPVYSGYSVTVATLTYQGNVANTGFVNWNCGGTTVASGGTLTMPNNNVTCNAVCATQYTVEYNCGNEGTAVSGVARAVGVYGPFDSGYTETTLSDNVCAHNENPDDWDFTWNCSSVGTNIEPGNTFTVTSNTVCTPNWTGRTYRVTYNCAGGTGSVIDTNMPNGGYVSGTSVRTMPAEGCGTKTGYTLDTLHWNCNPNGGDNTPANQESAFSITADTTCTAVWVPEDYTLTYKCTAGGDIEKTVSQLHYADSVYLANSDGRGAPTTCGPVTGWNCSAGVGRKETSGMFSMPASDVECVAVLTEYELLYDCDNGRDNGEASHNGWYEHGQTVGLDFSALNSQAFCQNHTDSTKEFDSWSCTVTPSCVGTSCTITMPQSNVTCTAQWRDKYMVTYDCTTGSLKSGYNRVDFVLTGQNYRFTTQDERCNAPAGYTASGFVCNAAVWTDAERPWNLTKNVTCTARWTTDMLYDVEYSCSGGSGTPPAKDEDHMVNTSVTLAENTCDASGNNEFKEWACKRKDNNQSVNTSVNNNMQTITSMPASDVSCVAQWNNKKYTVTYNKGSCERANNANYVHTDGATYGEVYYALPYSVTGIYAGTGYEFRGWNTQPGQSVANWTGEDPWNRTSNLTVYAVCTPKSYNVIYMQGNCSESGNYNSVALSDTVVYNQNYEVLGSGDVNLNVKPGWEFQGWRVSMTSVTSNYSAGYVFEPWTAGRTLELYALCTERPYHITYNCNSDTSCNGNDDTGCRTPIDDTEYNVGNPVYTRVGSSNTCKKSGYGFRGWNCVAQTGNTTVLSANSNVTSFTMPASHVVCTADWDENYYYVSYDCNRGGNEPQDATAYTYGADVETYGVNNPDRLNTCARTGYVFTKWLCGEGASAEEVYQGDTFKIYRNTTCRAQWEQKPYEIVYMSGNCGEISGVWSRGVLKYDNYYTVLGGLSFNIPKGYSFKGWSVDANSETVDNRYSPGQHGPWRTDGNLTLYAVCNLVECPITYHHNGGSLADGYGEPLVGYNVITQNEEIVESERVGYYQFGGWYDNPEFVGTPLNLVPGNNALDALRNDGTCGIDLYAKWIDTGAIEFDCTATGQTMTEDNVLNEFVDVPQLNFCNSFGSCEFSHWSCNDGRIVHPGEDMEILQVKHTVVCTPVKDCSGVRYNIDYNVYKIEEGVKEQISAVFVGDNLVFVNSLTPRTYSPGEPAKPYPVVSLPGCRFEGWYENENFAGTPVTTTPLLSAEQEGRNIVLYGKIDCGYLCNEPGQEHWLHIGGGENDKVCLYEQRQTNETPAVRVKRSNKRGEPYYLMLTEDANTPMHAGSEKRMRIKHHNKMYNVCDKTTCPLGSVVGTIPTESYGEK